MTDFDWLAGPIHASLLQGWTWQRIALPIPDFCTGRLHVRTRTFTYVKMPIRYPINCDTDHFSADLAAAAAAE